MQDEFKKLENVTPKSHPSIDSGVIMGILNHLSEAKNDAWAAELEKEDIREAYSAISKDVKEAVKRSQEDAVVKVLKDGRGRIAVVVGGIYGSCVDVADLFDGLYIYCNSKLTVTVMIHCSKKTVA